MKKFYSVADYAEKENVQQTTIRDRLKGRKLKSLKVYPSAPILIMEEEGDKSHIISFLNLKGGAAKSSTSVHLAIWLAKLKFKVLLIDTDHQHQISAFLPEIDYHYTIVDLLKGRKAIDCIYTIESTFNMDVMFSSEELAIFNMETPKEEWDLLDSQLESIKNRYDFIIIDTSPSTDITNINVARASTSIIVPLVPNRLHVMGMQHNQKALEIAQVELTKIIGILPTIVEKNLAQHTAHLEILSEDEYYSELLFDNYIPKDAFIAKAPDLQTNIFELRDKSKGSVAIKKFTWEMLQRL